MDDTLFYNITSMGRDKLRSWMRSNPPEKLATLEMGMFLEETRIVPLEVRILDSFYETDHGMDREEIKDRWGSEGLRIFTQLHTAGYLGGDPQLGQVRGK